MFKNAFFFVSALLTAVPAVAQMPDGSDISQAIPIYFGEVAQGIGDNVTKPFVVYAVNVAKGQQMTFAANRTTGTAAWNLYVLRPNVATVASAKTADVAVNYGNNAAAGKSLDYLVPADGTYYIVLTFGGTGLHYQVTIKSQGPIITTPTPAIAGCYTGQVDYITYSVQLITEDLPDEISVGGAVACTTCQVKPPIYSQIVNRLEAALRAQLPVSACYDGTGYIVQLKVMHP
jgi:hypothetical protein